jgi:hypothetical protein
MNLPTRRWLFLSLSILSLGSMIGCANSQSDLVSYPAPSFEGPRVAVAQTPPVYVAPRPEMASAMQTPAYRPRKELATPKMTGIPAAWVPPVQARPWRWIVVHHSATTTGGAAAFDKMHRAKGWDELGYDFVIGNGTDTADGQIEVGSRWVKQKIGAHAKTSDNRYNEYGVGICLVGNFDVERPTPAQMKSLDKLVAYLMVAYHISPENVLRHKDTKSTDCPGRYLNIDVVRRQSAAIAGASMGASKLSASSELLQDVPAAQ